jgi:hypothetical protein
MRTIEIHVSQASFPTPLMPCENGSIVKGAISRISAIRGAKTESSSLVPAFLALMIPASMHFIGSSVG